MEEVNNMLGKSIYNPSDDSYYIVSSFDGDRVKMVNFNTKKSFTLKVVEMEGLENNNENTYAGFSEGWINGVEFQDIE